MNQKELEKKLRKSRNKNKPKTSVAIVKVTEGKPKTSNVVVKVSRPKKQ